jgi:hypothetical protein
VDVRALRRALLRRLAALRAWATWSPRRARTIVGVCLAVLVVAPLATGVARSVAGGRGGSVTGTGEATAAPAPSPSPAASLRDDGAAVPIVTAAPSGPNDADARVSDRDQAAASAAARRFASLWLAGAFVPDRHRWVATMSGLVEPALLPFLESTPASAIPKTSVASTVPRLVAPSYGSVRVRFADRTGMDLEMSVTGTSWRVVQYLPTTGP